jgi:hypothetical protein
MGTVTITLDNLRNMLMGQDSAGYPHWEDFKRYVLEPARKELKRRIGRGSFFLHQTYRRYFCGETGPINTFFPAI